MTQQITVACQLGPAYSGDTISYKIYNVDGTLYADWTSLGFSEIGTTGTFLKANVAAPDAGGYIQFSSDGGSTVLGTVADILSANLTIADIMDYLIETGLTFDEAIRLIASSVSGVLGGAGTNTVTIRNAVANDKTRITATVDSVGNRTNIVYDLS